MLLVLRKGDGEMSEPTILTARLCGPEFEKRLDFLMRQMAHTCWTEEMAVAIRALHVRLQEYQSAANELADFLRDKWSVKDTDAIAIYCAALVAGIVEGWTKMKPENGFVHVSNFPDIGRVEIDIHRADGKSAAETIGELHAQVEALTDERDALSKQVDALLGAEVREADAARGKG